MDRRTFIRDMGKKTIGFSGCLFLLNFIGYGSLFSRKSKNWLWIMPDIRASDDDWKKRFDKYKKAGIDALLPEIYTGRSAYFGSSRLPVKAELLGSD